MQMTRRFLLGASGAVALPGLLRAQGNNPIRIGEINSYTANPAFTIPYRNAMQMAVDGVNAKGGVLGRPLELITRDDAGRPQDAVRLAGELVNDVKVDVLAGAYLSNVGLALSEFALQNKRLYVGGEPLTDAPTAPRGLACCAACGMVVPAPQVLPDGACPNCGERVWAAPVIPPDFDTIPEG